MSYADVAASGPKQSPEESVSRAAPVPTLEHSESETASLIDVDSPHVSSVRSDFEDQEVKTETQATRMEHQAEDSVRSESRKIENDTKVTRKNVEEKAKDTRDKLEEKTRDARDKVEEKTRDARDKVEEKAKQAKSAAKKEANKLKENQDNPVYIANALIWSVGAIALGVGAYQKHSEGKLDAKLAGSVAAAVGAFAVADYFGSQWLLANKYPTK